MTEPMDGSAKESDAQATPPDTEAAPETASTDVRGDPGEVAPGVPASSGWVAPEAGGSGGGLARGCVISVLLVAVVVLVGLVSLIFLGTQVQSSLAGTMVFGTGGTGCSVTSAATTFPASTAFRSVAYLERDTRPGETIVVAVTYPNGTSETSEEAVDDAIDCVFQDISPGLAPGHYGLEYRSGTEILAKGAFDITP